MAVVKAVPVSRSAWLSSMRRDHSTAYSMGSVLVMGSMKPERLREELGVLVERGMVVRVGAGWRQPPTGPDAP